MSWRLFAYRERWVGATLHQSNLTICKPPHPGKQALFAQVGLPNGVEDTLSSTAKCQDSRSMIVCCMVIWLRYFLTRHEEVVADLQSADIPGVT